MNTFTQHEILLNPHTKSIHRAWYGQALHGMLHERLRSVDEGLAICLHAQETKPFSLRYTLKGDNIILTLGLWDSVLRQALLCALWPGSKVTICGTTYQVETVFQKSKFDPADALPIDFTGQFTVYFRSPTCFRSSGQTVLFPEWWRVLASLYRDWKIAGGAIFEDDELTALTTGVLPTHYALETKNINFGTFMRTGFTGFCVYKTMPKLPHGVRDKLVELIQILDYVGVGYKTTMGMGAVDVRMKKGKTTHKAVYF